MAGTQTSAVALLRIVLTAVAPALTAAASAAASAARVRLTYKRFGGGCALGVSTES